MQTDRRAIIVNADSRTQWLPLSCGPLALYFDPVAAALRNIRIGGVEVVRNIYVAVRDYNWGTIAPQIEALKVEVDEDGFTLTFTARCQESEIDFAWRGTIAGRANGTIRFTMEGEARSTFRRNRIGFCVLHPIRECAGKPCRVLSGDTLSPSVFPDFISAHQPFFAMQSIAHQVLPGIWAEVQFEGDTFEMEDQRNWTDASFKTYSTPLALPYPVEVQAGTQIAQALTLTLQSEDSAPLSPLLPANDQAANLMSGARNASETEGGPVTLRFTEAMPIPLPQIGLGIASHGDPLSALEIERLKSLSLSHLRLDLKLSSTDWKASLQRATEQAQTLDIRLEIALFLPEWTKVEQMESGMAELTAALKRLKPSVVRWLVFPLDEIEKTQHQKSQTEAKQSVLRATELLRSATPTAQIGCGTNAYFAELNRRPPSVDGFDCVSYSMTPLVHAFDTATLMENLEAQPATVRSARQFCQGLPLVVSPVTLKPRFNPDATGSQPAPALGQLPPSVDARQCTLTGLGWTLGSLKALCGSQAHSVTYYETTGWRGVMETEAGSLLPERFPSIPGAVFPLYHAFADVGTFVGGVMLPMEASASGRVAVMALRTGERSTILCANLMPEPQTVRMLLPVLSARPILWQFDADSAERYQKFPESVLAPEFGRALEISDGVAVLELPPCAYVRLDWTE